MIRTLTEQHKKLAEEMLKGTQRSKIADDLGVDRSTIYAWMKDPVWQLYFEKLAQDLDEARSMRLLVTVMKAAEMTDLYLDHVIDVLKTGDVEAINRLPGLDTITTATKRIVELERLDSGKPTSHTRTTKTEEVPAEVADRRARTKGLLDRMLDHEEETQH